jgi:2-oxoglutarate dehydrogenase E2 component (dihydrolipoamide succinyltransferase)
VAIVFFLIICSKFKQEQMIIEVRLPAMGEGITDARLSRWLVKEGDFVKKDTPLLEISTDKVDSEIVAPSDSYVQKLLFNEDDLPKVGELLVLLSTEKDEVIDQVNPKTSQKLSSGFKLISNGKDNGRAHLEGSLKEKRVISYKFISPFIRTVAMQENVSVEELESIQGSGADQRITKDDFVRFLEERSLVKTPVTGLTQEIAKSQPPSVPAVSSVPEPREDVEYVELNRMRKMIAANMIRSKHTSPHVSSFVEVNVTRMVTWRNKVKKQFGIQYNENLTFLPLFIEAVIYALKKYPTINASLEGDFLAIKKNINIGIATALEDGNLIVPVISMADMLDLSGLVKQLNDLTNRARKSALLPSEIQGGTFTITNVGSVGNSGGTPIIRQPELAILAIGSIIKKPVAVKSGDQYGIAVADVVELWLSYDHRIIDGALGGSFLKQIADYLEDFNDARSV